MKSLTMQIWIVLFFVCMLFAGCITEIEESEKYKSIVINELLPMNNESGADQSGQYDDWIELYNLSDTDVDLSGCYLTDSQNDLTKWKFPDGTIIAKNGFLIVWADGDTNAAGLHASYKLSADGETVVLVTPEQNIIDKVKYPATTTEQSYARIPNGTGDFIWTKPTFNKSN